MKSNSDRAVSGPAIEFRNVFKSFDGKPALTDVSFLLNRGEMLIITGAAASGKSVLLHLAIGLIAPDSGNILVEDVETSGLAEAEMVRWRSGRIGLVFQEEALFTGLTVYENAAYRLRELNWSDADVDKAVIEILEFVGLHKDVEKIPEELSVGMKRRLEVARALAGWPPIMLFDEPTGGLDPLNNRQVLDLVIRARDIHNISSLYVTKELHEIPYLAAHTASRTGGQEVVISRADPGNLPSARVMVLDSGRVAFLGTAGEFESSTIPSVRNLTSPESSSRVSHEWSADPWAKARAISD